MAETPKVLGQADLAATTSTDTYTVPASKSAVISTITMANRSSAVAIRVRVSVAPAGATLEDKQYLFYDMSVEPRDTMTMTLGITLGATDVLRTYSTVATCSVNVFGMEIS